MMRRIAFLTLSGAFAAVAPASGQNELGETRNVLDKWVETRQLISEEKSEWRTEKSILRDTRDMLANESERLSEEIGKLETSATEAEEERVGLNKQKEELGEAAAVVEKRVAELERTMKTIVDRLPAPLVEKIKPIIRRLPEDPSDTKLGLGERVQNIVGILSQADKFNTSVTQTSESRELPDGDVVEVRTLYWGLAMAYYVDGSGRIGGTGAPTEDGWEWSEREASAATFRRLLNVYEGDAEIQFVEVPASLK